MLFVGARHTAKIRASGRYVGEYVVRQGGQAVLRQRFELTL
jgi:hypothetical protein